MSVHMTPKVCARARSLLKWNVNDLSKATNIPPKSIESFERGIKRLIKPENDAMHKAFKDNGIRFKDNMEVELVEVNGNRNGDGPVRTQVKLKEESYSVDDIESLVSQYFATKEAQDGRR